MKNREHFEDDSSESMVLMKSKCKVKRGTNRQDGAKHKIGEKIKEGKTAGFNEVFEGNGKGGEEQQGKVSSSRFGKFLSSERKKGSIAVEGRSRGKKRSKCNGQMSGANWNGDTLVKRTKSS